MGCYLSRELTEELDAALVNTTPWRCCTESVVAGSPLTGLAYATRSLRGIPRWVMMFNARPRIAPSVTWHSGLRLAR